MKPMTVFCANVRQSGGNVRPLRSLPFVQLPKISATLTSVGTKTATMELQGVPLVSAETAPKPFFLRFGATVPAGNHTEHWTITGAFKKNVGLHVFAIWGASG